MDGHDNIMGSETAEHLVSTPAPSASTANMLPSKRKNRSEAWDHFTAEEGPSKSAKCNYCGSMIKFNNGTSAMRAHLPRCKESPQNIRRHESISCSMQDIERVVSSSPSISKFDQDVSRSDLVKMFITTELPFILVEHPYVHKFINGLQPRFSIPSRTTLARDILRHWDTEKTKLKNTLSQHCRRVCLTTDTWTSNQNFNYMCLTAHFVDNNWKLQKRIVDFLKVSDYTGEVMAKTIEQCLNAWGLSRVLSVTVDNASSNDVGVQHLKSWLLSRNGLILKGASIHVHCCAHILNLIVREGMKDVNVSISRVRGAVRYIRRSPSRFARFKRCIDDNIEYKGYVSLDSETRWNSTYIMLDAALKHKQTFTELYFRDQRYVTELTKDTGMISSEDWDHVQFLLPFLKIFYNATLRISGTSYLTSNLYMYEVFGIGKEITIMCNSVDEKARSMATRMKAKYDKYWGTPDRLNMLLLIALVLDPRRKLKFVEWMSCKIYSSADAASLKNKLELHLKSIYEEYSGVTMSSLSNHVNQPGATEEVDAYDCSEFYDTNGCTTTEYEFTKYFKEDLEKRSLDFDLLDWWKVNSSRFPILGKIAREVLAIPISTVASEAAFSTGGRVLDDYRSSLTPTMVEALICSQDWLKGASSTFLTNEDLDELERIEREVFAAQDVGSSSVALEDD